MKRFVATYTLVPGRGLLINHVTTLSDDEQFVSCEPLTKELPHTRFVPHILVLLPAGQSYPSELTNSTLAEISALFTAMSPLSLGTPIDLFSK